MTEQSFDATGDSGETAETAVPAGETESPAVSADQEFAHEFDQSGDGIPDFAVQAMSDGSYLAVSDENGDLLADTFGLDLNGDGEVELLVTRQGEDYHVQVDQDGDGVYETAVDMTREELLALDPQVVAALDHQFGSLVSEDMLPRPEQADVPDPAVFDSPFVSDGQLVGDPVGDAEHWFQQAVNGFCVPASIAQIVSEYTGLHLEDEAHLVERANELKIFDVGPDGAPSITIDGALVLLEDAGVPASVEFGDGVDSLVQYLDEGRRVMLAVDSGEIWYGEQTEDQQADHAVVVTGVDLDRGVVIVSDPGDPEGNAREYPLSQFEDAWADSNFAALVCDVPPGALTAQAEELTPAAERAAPAALGPDFTLEQPGPVPSAGGEASPLERVVDWTIAHPWAVLPVLLGARAVAGARR